MKQLRWISRARKPAQGTKDPRFPELTQVVVRFEDELFAEIRDRAVAQETSFSEQVRMLVEWGLAEAKAG